MCWLKFSHNALGRQCVFFFPRALAGLFIPIYSVTSSVIEIQRQQATDWMDDLGMDIFSLQTFTNTLLERSIASSYSSPPPPPTFPYFYFYTDYTVFRSSNTRTSCRLTMQAGLV